MKFQSKLVNLANILGELDVSVYHYWRSKMEPPYVVWQEDGEFTSLEADNHKREQAVGGTIDYFTLEEFDEVVDDIQDKLNSIEGCYWSLNAVQYEDETNLIHFEWIFRLL